VAVDESGTLSGFVTAHASPTVPHAVFVPWLVVDAPARGRGIGRALMQAVLAAAAREGFVGVALYVGEDDREAQAFYDRLGGDRARYMAPRADAELKRGGQWIYRWILAR
jgi:ribosomal protein S18 acetylase RimI-like enzyme